MTTPADVPPPALGPVARVCWIGAGFVGVGIGSLGVVVPGLPTTVFFVFAAWCFSRSSPRFERWVLGLPRVGPLVRDYRSGLGMPRRAKVIAVSMMAAAVAASALIVRDRPLLSAVIVAAGLVGAWYVVRRVPTRETVLAERGPAERVPADGPPDRTGPGVPD